MLLYLRDGQRWQAQLLPAARGGLVAVCRYCEPTNGAPCAPVLGPSLLVDDWGGGVRVWDVGAGAGPAEPSAAGGGGRAPPSSLRPIGLSHLNH